MTTFNSNSREQKYKVRTNINQFLRDGSCINSLYDHTLQLMFNNNYSGDIDTGILKIFNSAYKLCWEVVDLQTPAEELLNSMNFSFRSSLSANTLSFCITWSILSMYRGLYLFDNAFLVGLRRNLQSFDLFSSFREFVRLQDPPYQKINFQSPSFQRTLCGDILSNIYSLDTDSAQKIITGAEAYNAIVGADSESDDTDSLVSRIQDRLHKLEADNTLLKAQLHEKDSEYQKIIESKDANIRRLKFVNNSLEKQIKEQQNHIEVKEVVKHVVVTKDNPLLRILNWNTIGDYALTLGTSIEVQAVFNMLNRLSTRNQYYDEDLTKTLDKVEGYLRQLQKPVTPVQNNTFHEGSCYNDIHDNPNSSVYTNGRR